MERQWNFDFLKFYDDTVTMIINTSLILTLHRSALLIMTLIVKTVLVKTLLVKT
jgi:hypothetical protein